MSPNKRKAIVFDLEGSKSKPKYQKTSNVQFQSKLELSKLEDTVDDGYLLSLQPEIMSLPQILEILEQNNFSSSILTGKNRKELENLFLAHITPKHQRVYRSNLLGKRLKLLQRSETKSQHSWSSMVVESKPKSTTQAFAGKNSIPTVGDRLKDPPVSLINTSVKKIKLHSSSSSLDKITINKRSSTDTSKDTNDGSGGASKKIKLSISKSADLSKDTSSPSPKKHASVSWP